MFHVNNTQVLHSQKVGIYLDTSLLLITRSVISTKVMIILNLSIIIGYMVLFNLLFAKAFTIDEVKLEVIL